MPLDAGPEIGHTLGPCTKSVKGHTVSDPKRPERLVRLIDTPGFNDSESLGDDEQVRLIIQWLQQEPKTKLVGILFLFDVAQPRVAINPEMMNPTHISDPPGVCIVTSKWSSQPQSQSQDAQKEQCLQAMFQKMPMRRFTNTPESAWEIINEVRDSRDGSKVTLEKTS